MINVYQPSLGKEELDRIKKVFDSNWLGKGKLTDEFEKNFSEHLQVSREHTLSTNCCSEGLFSAMHLMHINPGDEVIIPTISFIGAGNAICANGSIPVMCDVDRRTQNVRAEDIEPKITKKTKAILLIHYGGVSCEMDEILKLAEDHHLKVIEDSACSVYSTYKGKACGTLGDMGMWSFDAMKILVCGDGAMLYFKNPEDRELASKWLYFGLESKSGYSNTVDKKWWEFEVSCFGHRAIMNDVTAAMGLEQLKKLPQFIEKRKEINDHYNKRLIDVSWLNTPVPLKEYQTSSYYFYPIQVLPDARDDLAKHLRDNNIYTTYRYYPLHRVKAYKATGTFPNADWAANHTLCLPIHQAVTSDEVDYIVDKIIEFGKNKKL